MSVRQVVFGLMVFAVAVCAFAYAGSSTPWAGSAYALLPSASTPAPPTIIVDWVTPTQLKIYWEADTSGVGATPDVYYVVADGVLGPINPAEPATSREMLFSSLVPGSTHTYQVYVGRTGTFGGIMWSDPATLVRTQPGVFDITPSAGAGGSISPSTVQTIDQGQDSPLFTITPNPGFRVAQIKDGATVLSGTPMPNGAVQYQFWNVHSPHAISATFESTTDLFSVWRFRQLRATGSYLWTPDPAEKANIQANLSKTWLFEGAAFSVNRANPINSSTLWRFRNLKSGSYLYTADPAEKATIQANLAKTWKFEGPTWNVSRGADASALPVWRFRCLKNTTYLWTSDPSEKQTIETTLQSTYKLEGVAYYVGQ